MRLTALSGAGSKGPACFLLDQQGRRLLFDLGEGPDRGVRPNLTGVGMIDAVLLSHRHADHAGALDMLPVLGSPPVHATALVRALPGPALPPGADLPLRGMCQIAGLTITTGRAGHAPGGVWLHVAGDGDVLYLGDHCQDSPLWAFDPPPPAGLVILDASYGADDRPATVGRAGVLAAARRGPLLLPAPAGGRSLEMALWLARQGVTNIALCPEGLAVFDQLLSQGGDMVHAEAMADLRRLRTAVRLLTPACAPAGVMIAATPNGDGGLAASLLARWVGQSEVAILFTGYLAAGTPARHLTDSGRAQNLRWNVHPRRSEALALVRALGARSVLPAFGPADDLAGWQRDLAPAAVGFGPFTGAV